MGPELSGSRLIGCIKTALKAMMQQSSSSAYPMQGDRDATVAYGQEVCSACLLRSCRFH